MVEQRGVVVHIAAGYFEGTISWQRNPDANVSSHFVVARDGRIAQMVDTDVTAWTQRSGNGHWLSIENEGFLPQSLTAAQVEANARILARAYRVYGVPLQVTDTPARRGLGHHSMGAENGYDWGHPACPGPAITAQKPAIVARAIAIVNGDDDMFSDEDRAVLRRVEWAIGRGVPLEGGTGTEALTWAWPRLTARLDALLAKVDIDPAELDAVKAAAREGAADAADELVAAVLSRLPADAITPAQVEQAVRDAFAGGLAPGPAG